MTSTHLDWARKVRSVAEEEPQNVVIVGGGVAAHRCAFDLRTGGYRGKLTILSKETHPPYDRTLVSKDMLLAGAPEPIGLSDADRYRRAGVDLRLGVEARSLDVHDRCIGTKDGRCVSFDRLVLAFGGVPALPPALTAEGVLVLREAADVPRLKSALRPDAHVVVIGAGFIGGEVATVARRHGAEVTLLEAAEEPLSAVFGADVGARIADLHRSNGVKLMTGAVVDSVARSPQNNFLVSLADGARLEADEVVVAVGMRPNTDWLHGSGIVLDGGVVTDANCRTSADAVFAAGDCARWWHPGYGAFSQVEHWDTANRHGAAIASALLGEPQAFAPLPFFWSDQHGVKFQFAGRPSSFEDVRVEESGPQGFAARYFVHGELTAVLAANQSRVFAQTRRELLAHHWPMTDRPVRKVPIR
jgi:NADPH-dependent 2,4-dienoyl-CoA reductase/sulfur reductase-like enzyme